MPNTFLKFTFTFLRGYKWPLLGIMFLASLTGFYGTIIAYLIKILIDTIAVIDVQDTAVSADAIIKASLWPAIFFVLNYEMHDILWRGVDYLNLKTAPKIKNHLIEHLFAYVHKHSIQFFQENFAGTISSNITIFVDNLEKTIHSSFLFVLTTSVQLMIALVAMYSVNVIFAMGLLVWVIGFLAVRFLLAARAKALAYNYAWSQSIVSGKLVDSFQGVGLARLFARSHFESFYLLKYLEIMREKFIAKEWFVFVVSFWQGLSISALISFMLFFLIKLRTQNLVSIGDFALILGLVLTITKNMWTLTKHIDSMNDALGKCNQSLKMLLLPLEIEDSQAVQMLNITKGAIDFQAVQFHYKGSAPLFQNQSLSILPGQRVGLVGYSGSGKSTFVNLILRLFEVNLGKILIDGQDIKEVTLFSLRNNIGMIPQDPALFHRSVMENIRYGCLQATDLEVIDAAKKAQAHEFIQNLPYGYETMVGERGVKLSGGQKQRISIARAILKNAPILILDEATSQLDSLTENEIQASFWTLMKGKTTLVVAHRLSTLLHMDRIIVFDKGKIIEDGTHHDLLAYGGLYTSLWDAQIGGLLPNSSKQMAVSALDY